MKRSSYLRYDEIISLGKRGLTVWGYDKSERFVCRVEINAVGLALYGGAKGRKSIANASGESLVKKLSPVRRRR